MMLPSMTSKWWWWREQSPDSGAGYSHDAGDPILHGEHENEHNTSRTVTSTPFDDHMTPSTISGAGTMVPASFGAGRCVGTKCDVRDQLNLLTLLPRRLLHLWRWGSVDKVMGQLPTSYMDNKYW